jgi:hypothetical protein
MPPKRTTAAALAAAAPLAETNNLPSPPPVTPGIGDIQPLTMDNTDDNIPEGDVHNDPPEGDTLNNNLTLNPNNDSIIPPNDQLNIDNTLLPLGTNNDETLPPGGGGGILRPENRNNVRNEGTLPSGGTDGNTTVPTRLPYLTERFQKDLTQFIDRACTRVFDAVENQEPTALESQQVLNELLTVMDPESTDQKQLIAWKTDIAEFLMSLKSTPNPKAASEPDTNVVTANAGGTKYEAELPLSRSAKQNEFSTIFKGPAPSYSKLMDLTDLIYPVLEAFAQADSDAQYKALKTLFDAIQEKLLPNCPYPAKNGSALFHDNATNAEYSGAVLATLMTTVQDQIACLPPIDSDKNIHMEKSRQHLEEVQAMLNQTQVPGVQYRINPNTNNRIVSLSNEQYELALHRIWFQRVVYVLFANFLKSERLTDNEHNYGTKLIPITTGLNFTDISNKVSTPIHSCIPHGITVTPYTLLMNSFFKDYFEGDNLIQSIRVALMTSSNINLIQKFTDFYNSLKPYWQEPLLKHIQRVMRALDIFRTTRFPNKCRPEDLGLAVDKDGVPLIFQKTYVLNFIALMYHDLLKDITVGGNTFEKVVIMHLKIISAHNDNPSSPLQGEHFLDTILADLSSATEGEARLTNARFNDLGVSKPHTDRERRQPRGDTALISSGKAPAKNQPSNPKPYTSKYMERPKSADAWVSIGNDYAVSLKKALQQFTSSKFGSHSNAKEVCIALINELIPKEVRPLVFVYENGTPSTPLKLVHDTADDIKHSAWYQPNRMLVKSIFDSNPTLFGTLYLIIELFGNPGEDGDTSKYLPSSLKTHRKALSTADHKLMTTINNLTHNSSVSSNLRAAHAQKYKTK